MFSRLIIHNLCTNCNVKCSQNVFESFVHFYIRLGIDNRSRFVYNMGTQNANERGAKMTIGEKIRRLRGKESIQCAADALGVSRSALVKYERNERIPRDEVKRRIADRYGVSVQDIFFE